MNQRYLKDLPTNPANGTIRAMRDNYTWSGKFLGSTKSCIAMMALLFLLCPVEAGQKSNAKVSRASASSNAAKATDTTSYARVANQAVAVLVKKDIAAFKRLLSVKLLDRLGFAPTEAKLKEEVLPFFASYVPTSEGEKVTPTQDIFGNTGFAFYRVAVDKNGARKPFFVQVVKERGRLVIANLFVNKGYDDLNVSR